MKKNEKANARKYFYLVQSYERDTGESALGKDGKPKGVFKEYLQRYGIKPTTYTTDEKKDIISSAIREGLNIQSFTRKFESRTDHKAYKGNIPTNLFVNAIEEYRFQPSDNIRGMRARRQMRRRERY